MKRIISQKAYLVCMVIMSVFVSILSGCGGGGGGSWKEPGTPGARPTVVATVPATTTPGPTLNVPINSAITVAFSKDMTPGSVTAAGAITITGPGSTPVQGAVPAVTYDAASKTATFHPLAPLTGGVIYTATVKGTGANPVKDTDVAANALAGNAATPLVANDYVWKFTTSLAADTTRPLVTITVPATTTPGPTLNVPTNSLITAVFNEDMAPATLTASGAFTVTGPGSTPVAAAATAVTYDVASKTATFHPLAPLVGGVTYTATIKGIGTNPATDEAGNALAGNPATPLVANDYVWTFTTSLAADTTRPLVTITVPATTTPGPTLNVLTSSAITATFNEDMLPSTLTAPNAFTVTGPGVTLVVAAVPAVTYDVATRTATFHPLLALASGTTYTATIKGIGAAPARDSAGNALAGVSASPTVANDYVWRFTTAAAVVLPPDTHLGLAATYGIMATSAITNTGVGTHIYGDVALQPGTSNGILPVQVTGTIHINDSASNDAYRDLLIGYNYYKGLPRGTTITGGADLGGLYPGGVIPPGTYTSDSTMLINTPITLDAGGNPNAVWVFQIGSSLTTTTPQGNVLLLGGAQARNVYWVPTASATIGINTTFNGTVIAGVSITGQTGAVINGRLLAGAIGAGTIALDTNQVTVPAP